MADKSNNLSDVLIRAKISLDEAISAALGQLNPGELQKLKQDSVNTSCTNTGCGKSRAEEVSLPG